MKINDTRTNVVGTTLEDLPVGSTFFYKEDLHLKIKVDTTDVKPDPYFNVNVVNLKTSTFNRIKGSAWVIPVNAEVNIT